MTHDEMETSIVGLNNIKELFISSQNVTCYRQLHRNRYHDCKSQGDDLVI